ncbi:ROK family protein [Oceaniradius stylonematis]|uniref:ROK family protein n=1 Tax=Oceaniradius stylonematis TaxID=2184161 RepID=UPI00273E567F|nr:ROK family protein [Oceaniradius stylonematis]
MSRALCIDVGGTNLRAGLSGADDPGQPEPLGHWPAPGSRDAFVKRIAELLDVHGTTRLGMAIPGLADGTVCAWVPNLPYLDGIDLRALFAGIDIALGNDAQLALLAESVDGHAHDVSDAILLAIGTGIGSAVLADGRIVRGAGGGATSFGWACADPTDGGDAAHGWLERHAAGRALDDVAASLGLGDGAALIAAARVGSQAALDHLRPPSAALGVAAAAAVALLGSRAVIFAGGVADSLDVLAPLVEPVMRRQLPPHLRSVRLTAAKFGSRAGIVGASLAAHGHPTWVGRMP